MRKTARGNLVCQGLDQVDVTLGKDAFDGGDDHVVVEHALDLIVDRLAGRRDLDIHREARALGDALLMGVDADLGIEHQIMHEDAVVGRIGGRAAGRYAAGACCSLFYRRHWNSVEAKCADP